jgi:hypothetical protein
MNRMIFIFRESMKPLHLLLIATCIAFAGTAPAQDTNALKTALGVFEAQTGVLMVKGFGEAGSMSAGAVEIFVRGKETFEVNTSHKLYGLDIEIAGNGPLKEHILVDDDEIGALLGAMDYLQKITSGASPLTSFDATYTTKCGLRINAYSIRRNGNIQTFLRYDDNPRIELTSGQLTQLYNLIDQAAKALDALKTGK